MPNIVKVVQITQRPLLMIAMAAAIPLLLFAGWVTYLTATQERAAARAAAFEALDRVSTRLAWDIRTQIEVAETLAASTSLDKPDLSTFYLEARRLAEMHPLWETVELTDPAGSQVLNVLRPFGDHLGPTADLESFQKVAREGIPAVGGIGPVGPVSGRRLVAFRVPVHRHSELRYILTVHFVPDAVTRILRDAGPPAGWIGVVIDGKGNIIARTVAEQFELGRPASASARQAMDQGHSGAYLGKTLEGVEVESVYRTLPDIGWSVHLGLPTSILNAPVTRSIFFLAGGGIASLALGLGLAWLTARDIAQRRQDEQMRNAWALGASEERRAVAVEAAELGTFSWNFEKAEVIGSQRTRDFLCLPGQERFEAEWIWPADKFLSRVHAADRAYLSDSFRQCLEHETPVDLEFRALDQDGAIRWLRVIGKCPRFHPGAKQLMYGVLADIDAQKRAERERSELQQQLVTAQENEQQRIARELHDQIGQTVTGLSLGLKALEQQLTHANGNAAAAQRISWLQDLTSKIGQDIHQVASDLRPSALDDLGLEQALSTLGSEWSERFGIEIDIQILGSPLRIPRNVETAVYRIGQEALTNVLKHAKAKTVSIVLEQRPDQLRLIIDDDGVGFDPFAFSEDGNGNPRQLGLSGIRERLGPFGGRISIESEPGSGTTLYIVVPNIVVPNETPGGRPA